ncbi:TRAF3-interacting JNK-activating modulator isoform X3 [Protopterus annectens]|uniref:TRAF3-interacting JNK-activating modulator isoform X3 n=1 Tax=Protopterus annectens TaxID=7888 RepID=UPI001CFAD1D4|nr:TRAF3-interacting JNK-activating modulator isoform X3 [Protopterus annectens]
MLKEGRWSGSPKISPQGYCWGSASPRASPQGYCWGSGSPRVSPQGYRMDIIRSPTYQRQLSESYEDRIERRHQNREYLRARRNITTCRSHRKSWNNELEEKVQNLRQEEFLKRRNLTPAKEVDKSDSPRLFKQRRIETTAASGKISWVINESPCQATFIKEISKRERGTQTYTSTKSRQHASQQTDYGTTVLNEEIMQLSDYLKEALHREFCLKQKLAVLQQLLPTLLQTSEKSWKALLAEDALRNKVTTLETQLLLSAKNYTRDSLKKAAIQMEEQKLKYEQKAKESLQRVIKEKLATEEKLQNSQKQHTRLNAKSLLKVLPKRLLGQTSSNKNEKRDYYKSLTVTEQDCLYWKEHYEMMKKNWSELCTKNTELNNELLDLQSKLQIAEGQKTQLQELEEKLGIMGKEQEEMQSRLDVLHEDNELKKEQLSTMKVKVRSVEEEKLTMGTKFMSLEVKLRNAEEKKQNIEKSFTNLKEKLKTVEELKLNTETKVAYLEEKLKTAEEMKLNMETKVAYLEAKLRNAEAENVKMEARVTSSEASLREKSSQLQMEEILHKRDIMRVLQNQKEDTSVAKTIEAREKKLQDELQQAESRIKSCEKECAELRAELEALGDEYYSCQTKLQQCREELNHFHRKHSRNCCTRWIPFLMLLIATAMAAFYSNMDRFFF